MTVNIYSKMELDKIYLSYGEKMYLIDMKLISMENPEESTKLLKNFMENDKITKVIHDGKNLVTTLTKLGYRILKNISLILQ